MNFQIYSKVFSTTFIIICSIITIILFIGIFKNGFNWNFLIGLIIINLLIFGFILFKNFFGKQVVNISLNNKKVNFVFMNNKEIKINVEDIAEIYESDSRFLFITNSGKKFSSMKFYWPISKACDNYNVRDIVNNYNFPNAKFKKY